MWWCRPLCVTYEAPLKKYIVQDIEDEFNICYGVCVDKLAIQYIEHVHTYYDYFVFDNDKVMSWKSMLRKILEQNPELQSVQFHSEQVYDNFVFYIEMKRENLDKITVYKSPDNCHHFYTQSQLNIDLYDKIWFLLENKFEKTIF